MIKLTVMDGPDAGSVFTPTTGAVVIGRGQNCDIVLHDSIVSRRHCVIQYEEGNFVVTDLHTPNGTFLNGPQMRVTSSALRDQDELILGSSRLRIELPMSVEKKPVARVAEPATDDTPSSRSFAPGREVPSWFEDPLESLPGNWQSGMTVIGALAKIPPAPERLSPATKRPAYGQEGIRARISTGLKTIKLTVVDGPDAGSVFTSITSTVIIGRGRNCDIVLHDSIVSRRHCVIQYEEGHLVVADLHTPNGTFLNDPKTRIITHALRDGDELILGKSRLRIELPGAVKKKPVAMVAESAASDIPFPRSSAPARDVPSWFANPLDALPESWQSGMTVIGALPQMPPTSQRLTPAVERPKYRRKGILARVTGGLKRFVIALKNFLTEWVWV